MELPRSPYYLPLDSATYEDETLSWSAQIQPGNWIVVVEGTDVDENGGGIAIGLLEASVQEGATLDLVMEKGGLISISTTWLTIDSDEFHAGDVADGVEVEIDLGDGAWEVPFDSNGEIEMILPAGSISFDSEFESIRRPRPSNGIQCG